MAGEHWRLIAGRVMDEKIAEQNGLLAKRCSPWVMREEVAKFVAKDGSAGRLKEDDRDAGVDLWGELGKDSIEVAAGGIEKAEVVEWPSATDVLCRDAGGESGRDEDGVGSGEGLRVVVVVPSVRPEEHGLS